MAERNVLKDLSLMTVSVGITMVISLGLRMGMPRVFGPEAIGTYYLAESFANLFFVFLPLGLGTYISRTLPSRPEHTSDILSTILTLQLIAGTVIGLIMWGALLWEGKDPFTIAVFLLMGVYSALFNFQRGVFQKIYIALNEVTFVSRLNVAIRALQVGGGLAALYFYPSLIVIAAFMVLGELLGLLVMMIQSRKRDHFTTAPNMETVKTMLKVSLPFYLAGVLNGVYAEIDTIMLGKFSTSEEVGYFGAAFKLIGVFLMFTPVIQNSWMPPLSEAMNRNDGSFEVMMRKMLQIMLACSLPLTIGLTLFGDMISLLLYSVGFEPSYKILVFLTPVLTMIYLNNFVGTCHHLISSGNRISIVFVFGILVNVVLAYVTISYGSKNFGLGGAGLAVTLCTFLCELFVFVMMMKMLPFRVINFRMVWNLLVIFLPCWTATYYFAELMQLGFFERFGLLMLTPFYALATGLLTPTHLREGKALVLKKLKRKSGGSHA